jgi:VanZ family protein
MNRLLSWLLVVLWATFIFTFSADLFSSEHTASVILPVLHWLLPRASEADLEFLHLLIRKCAHIFEYFVFGLLLFRAVRGPRSGWSLRWAAAALLIAAVFAASDEFHQLFVPSRTASGWDALLDASAAAAAQAVMWLVVVRSHRAGGNGAAPQTS